jgi:phage host-nuclease inhibitor protein Gam
MSEQDFLSKQANIHKVYQQKLDEVKHLIEHFDMRISCFRQQNQKGTIDHGAEEQIAFDERIKDRLQREESEYKTEMNEEVARLKKTYEQSQRAQIQQRNIP